MEVVGLVRLVKPTRPRRPTKLPRRAYALERHVGNGSTARCRAHYNAPYVNADNARHAKTPCEIRSHREPIATVTPHMRRNALRPTRAIKVAPRRAW